MKVVISYKNADLDGVASAVGYSEYLNMIGEEASYYLNGSYQREVDLLCSMFQINLSNLLDNLDNSFCVFFASSLTFFQVLLSLLIDK